jgi:uridine kinase
MNMQRPHVIGCAADVITNLARPHPIRVALDGRSASGKTTLANELANALMARNRTVITASVDGFHRPRTERYRQGRGSPVGYLDDARDHAAIRRLLLDPLGPGGDRLYRTMSFDLDKDEPFEQPPRLADETDILIVEGTFLQRPELVDGWDVVVFVETSEEVATRRAIERDQHHLGGRDRAALLHANRYQVAFAIYEQRWKPRETAHLIIGNNDLATPTLTIRCQPR